jgi:epoxyqueuosine reductase QueG
MRSYLLDEAKHHVASTGLNLFGVVDAERFDAWQPREQRTTTLLSNCGTVIVLGSGGRTTARLLAESHATSSRAVPQQDVVPFVRVAAQELARMLQSHSVRNRLVEPDRHRLNFPRLAEAAGFGTVSPVSGLLLHPDFGPWVSVRAALLIDGRPFGPVADASITDRFQPCCNCARPCIAACPASVHDAFGNQDLRRCAGHRHQGGCTSGCATRSACPVGADHRDGIGEDVHRHTHTLVVMQRWFGFGVWRLVPRFLRGGR